MFLIRGLIAVVWADVCAAVASAATAALTVTAGVVLVLHPLIDAVAPWPLTDGQGGGSNPVPKRVRSRRTSG